MNQFHQLLIHAPDPNRRPRIMLSLARNPLRETATKPAKILKFRIGEDEVNVYYWGIAISDAQLTANVTAFVNWVKRGTAE